MDIETVLKGLPGKVKEKVAKAYHNLTGGNEPLRPDLAMVKAFNKEVLGQDNVKQMTHWTHRDWTRTMDGVLNPENLPQDEFFYYRPVRLTVSGVNLNRQFKSPDELRKTANRQKDHVIPSVNDHPPDRVKPLDSEVSGFVFGIHAEDQEDDEVAIMGIDAIPKGDPTLLNTFGVSIGYTTDQDEAEPGAKYKDAEYWYEQKNITLVHNARMVTQRPSVPPDVPTFAPGEAHGAGYDKDNSLDQAGPNEGTLDENNKPKGDKKPMEGDETKDQVIADLQKQVQDLQAQLKAGEDKALQDRLKASEDRVQELKTQLQDKEKSYLDAEKELVSLRPAKEELDTIKKSRRDSLVKKFKEAFPDMTDEEISKRDDEWLKDLLKVKTGKADFDTPVSEEGDTLGGSSKPVKRENPRGVYNRDTGKWEGGLEI